MSVRIVSEVLTKHCLKYAITAIVLVSWVEASSAAVSTDVSAARTWSDPLATRPALLDQVRLSPKDPTVQFCSTSNLDDGPLGLAHAVDLALCNNPKIRNAWLLIRAQAAALGIAEATFLPTVSANTGRQRSVTSFSGSPLPASSVSGNTFYASLNWRLFDFGARAAERESANHLLLAAVESHDAMVQKVMEETVQAYFDAQSARATWQAKEEGTQITSAILASARRREANRTISRSDTLQAATADARALLERNRALGDYRKANAVLIYMMGVSADSKLILDDMGSAVAAPHSLSLPRQVDDLDQWLRYAQRRHPSILAASSHLEAAQAHLRSTKADGLPAFDLSINYYRNGYPNQGISGNGSNVGTVGVSISFPIFTGFSHTYRVHQAQVITEQRETDVAEAEHQILMALVKAYSDVRSAQESLDASSVLLSTAQDALASSQRKYENGAAEIVEMLNAQRELAEAKQERVRAIGNWRSARLRLMAAAGQLDHADLDFENPDVPPQNRFAR